MRLALLFSLVLLAAPAWAQDFQIVALEVTEEADGTANVDVTIRNQRRTASHYSVMAVLPGAALQPLLRSTERLAAGAEQSVRVSFDASGFERPLTGAISVRNHRREEVDREPFTLPERVRPALTPARPPNRTLPAQTLPPVRPDAPPVEIEPQEAVTSAGALRESGSSLGFHTALLSEVYRTDQLIRSRRFVKAIQLLVQIENRGPEVWNAPVTLQATAERWKPGSTQRFGHATTIDLTFDDPIQPGESVLVPIVLGQRMPEGRLRAPAVPFPGAEIAVRPVLVYDDALSWRDGMHFSVQAVLSSPRDGDPSDNGIRFEGRVHDGLRVTTEPASVHRHAGTIGTATAGTRPGE